LTVGQYAGYINYHFSEWLRRMGARASLISVYTSLLRCSRRKSTSTSTSEIAIADMIWDGSR
jgi:hypothetical protein